MTFRKVADICVLVGIFIGLMIADASTAEHYLSEWQTLVAGILAVIAAAWTVGEMRRNDEMQQARHEELMRLNIRADRLRIARATVPHADEMAATAKRIQRILDGDFLTGLALNDQSAFTILFNERVMLEQVVSIKAVEAASGLFDAETTYDYKILRMSARAAVSAGNITTFQSVDLRERTYKIRPETIPNVENAWRAVAVALDRFVSNLTALKKTYDLGRL